jgi:2C-methyl-D-erythritol 2,4-cyclodiphosphate synthase
MNEDLIKEKFNHHQERLDDHEKRIDSLEKTYSIMEKMDYRMGNVEKSVQKINDKLDNQQREKGNKWDKLIDYIFYFVIATILGYVAISMGMK